MNNVLKRIAIVSGILLLLGIGCSLVGVLSGGMLNYVFNLKTHEVYVPTKDKSEVVEESINIDAFDVIEIKVDCMDLEIKSGDRYRVEYSVPSGYVPTVDVNNQKLVIESKKENANTYSVCFDILDMQIGSFSVMDDMKMTITVPKDKNLNDIKVSSDAGRISFIDLNGNQCEIQAKSGDMIVENSNIKKVMINADAGKVDMKNIVGSSFEITVNSGSFFLDTFELETLKLNADCGDISIKDGTMKNMDVTADCGKILIHNVESDVIDIEDKNGDILLKDVLTKASNIICECGDCDLGLLGNIDEYDIDAAVSLGELEINGEKQGNHYNNVNRKEKCIVVQNDCGDIDIWIQEKE